MSSILPVFVALYLALVALLLTVAYSRRLFRWYAAAKGAASAGFLLLAAAAWLAHGRAHTTFFLWLLPCLVCCCAGDILLGLANTHGKLFSRFFLGGVAAFMMAHVFFCVLFTVQRPGGYRFVPAEYLVPALCVLVMVLCIRDSRRFHKLYKMRVPGVLYAGFVGLMCAKGIGYGAALGFAGRGLWVALGCVLFLISDAFIIFLYFYYRERKVFRGINLGAYYLALLFLALAA